MAYSSKTPHFDNVMNTDQGTASVATPPSGIGQQFIRNGYLYGLNSSGVEYLLGAVIMPSWNYITNPHPVGNTNGWATYADAAGSIPVNGTGGSPSITFTRNTTTPLHAPADFKLTKGAANRQGEGASFDFTIDNMYAGQTVQIGFDYNSDGAYAAGDMIVYMYDVTNSALIAPSSTSIGTGKNRMNSTFVSVSSSTSYRLIFHIATTNASAYNVYFDNILVGITPITREVLTGTRNYYVATTGSNSNAGLTAGSPFLTIQKAIDTIAGLDINTRAVNINVADGTYTGATLIQGAWLGSGVVSIIGNTSTPANVIISTTNADAIRCINGASITLSGMEIRTTTSGQGVRSESTGFVTIGASMRFGAVANSQIYAETNSVIFGRSAYTVSGSAQCQLEAVTSAAIDLAGITVTVSGTPAFSVAFAKSSRSGTVQVNANTYSGSATGVRYDVSTNGVIFTNGGGATYLPGNSAGTTATGGQYT